MKKLILFFIISLFTKSNFAQTTENKLASTGEYCVNATFGGCISYGLGTFCTETILHVRTCCGRVVMGAPYCNTTTWSTPVARATNTTETLETIVTDIAIKNKLDIKQINTFSIKDCEPFVKDGETFIITAKDYAIDKTVKGWQLTNIEFTKTSK
jgi:hypothetical protein